MARSIGSKGMGSLDYIESVINSFVSAFIASVMLNNWPVFMMYNLANSILFSVMVPVLSVQITVAQPNVSTVWFVLR